MASFDNRLAEFVVDRLPDDASPVELLCFDHNGTYVVPFPCCCVDGAWRNLETNEVIEASVAGWRRRDEWTRNETATRGAGTYR